MTLGVACTNQDHYNAILYEHSVVNQAASAAAPQAVAPPWFQAAMNQLRADIRADILPDLKRLLNKTQGDGRVVPYDIVPLPNGQDPTLPPHNLPALTSQNIVYGLNAAQLNNYLIGYAVGPVPPGANAHATNQQRKDALMRKIKAA